MSLGTGRVQIRPELIQGFANKVKSDVEQGTSGLAGTMGGIAKKMAAGFATAFTIKKAFDIGGDAVDKFREVAGETGKLMRVTGGTAEEMSRLRFAASQVGISGDKLTASFMKLSKGGLGGSSKAFAAMGISLKDSTGKVRPLTQVLGEVGDKFKAMPEGAQKNADAMTLFGKAGGDLIPLLNKGSAGFAELAKKSDAFGMTISGNQVKDVKAYAGAQRDWAAASDGVKVSLGSALLPIMTKMMTFITTRAIPAFQAIRDVIANKIAPALKTLWDKLEPVRDAISKVVDVIWDFVRANSTEVFAALGVAFAVVAAIVLATFVPALWAAATAFFALVWPIALIVAAIAALAFGVVYAYRHFEWFADVVDAVWQGIKDVVGAVADWFMDTVWPAIKRFADYVKEALGDAAQWIISKWPEMKRIAMQVWDAILSAARAVADWFMEHIWPTMKQVSDWIAAKFMELVTWVRQHWGDIKAAIGAAWDWIVGKILIAVAWITDVAWPAIKRFGTRVAEVFGDLVNWVRQHWGDIKAAIGEAWDWVVAKTLTFVTWITDEAWPAIKRFASRIGEIFGSLVNWVRQHWDDIKGVIMGAWNTIAGWFDNVTLGDVWEGVLNGAIAAWDTISGAVVTAWDFISGVVGGFISWFTTSIWPTIKKVIGWVATEFGKLVGWIREHWDQIKKSISDVWGTITGIISIGMTVFGAIFDVIVVIVKVALAIVGGIIYAVVKTALFLWNTFGDTIMSVFQAAWDAVMGIIEGAWEFVAGIFAFFNDLFHGRWGELWQDVKDVFFGVWHTITAFFSGIWQMILVILKDAAIWLVDKGKALLTGMWDGIKSAASSVWDWFKGLPGSVLSAIGDLGKTLWDAGSKLMSGLWDGMMSVGSKALDIAKGIANGLIGFINDRLIGGLNGSLDLVWRNIPFTSGNFPYHIPNVPKFHDGGVFSAGGGEGLALLRHGEGIFTPEQMKAMGGRGVGRTYNLNTQTIVTSKPVEEQFRMMELLAS